MWTLIFSITIPAGAQYLHKVAETDAFTDYRLVNDSLKIAPPHELLIDFVEGRESFRILEQDIVAVQLDESHATFLSGQVVELIEGMGTPLLDAVDPGIYRKRRVATLRIHSSRQDDNDPYHFQVVRQLKFRVFKHPESPQARIQLTPTATADHPLAGGDWYKIPVTRDGLYRIDREYLERLGINVSEIDPRNLQIWGTDGYELPHLNSISRPAFDQIPVFVRGESDGNFGSQDYLLFYGNSPDRVTYHASQNSFSHRVHPYSNHNYIFLTVGNEPGIRLQESSFSGDITRTVDDFRDFIWFEEHRHKAESRVNSGLHWLGQLFSPGISSTQTILRDTIAGYIPNTPVDLSIQMGARSEANSRFDFQINSQSISGSLNINRITSLTQPTGIAARLNQLNYTMNSLQMPDDIFQVEATFVPVNPSDSRGWLDWIRVRLYRELTAVGDKLIFYSPEDGEPGQGGQYRLSGFSSRPYVMEISDPANPTLKLVGSAQNRYTITSSVTPGTRFIAQSSPYTPAEGEKISNQNLHGISDYPDYIIITNELFFEQAHELAVYREENDGLRPVVVTQNQIFNEFSGGVPDVAAIRDFVKYLYDRAGTSADLPSYLLFFGDATFDYKGIIDQPANVNHVFTYQSEEALLRQDTFGSDDFFGFMGENEGSWNRHDVFERIDLGIGRLPIQSIDDARLMVEKIINYERQENAGDWRTLFTFVADDDVAGRSNDRDLHLLNADGTAEQIDRTATGIRLHKLYQFSYPVENTPTGRRSPMATQALIDRINNGTLIVNYSGHGNERVLSDERIFSIDDIPRLNNRDRLGILVTATCEFGRYDGTESQSGAEQLMLHQDGGMVAALTTTRVVYTSQDSAGGLNYALNIQLTRQMVQRDDEGKPRRLGDIYRSTKNTSAGMSFNSRKFIFLGDPAMRIGLPREEIQITKINGQPADEGNTFNLRALDRVTIEGEVVTANGSVNTGFNGEANLRVFDAERLVDYPNLDWLPRCFVPECGYRVQNDIIFNGRVSVANGRFSSEFIVPKDIAYSDSTGKIQVYARHSESDAVGAFSSFNLNGRNPEAHDDGQGPAIEVFLNDESFMNGSLVNDSPLLVARLSDDTGINTGAGIGHEIVAILTNESGGGREETIILNEFYQSDLDDFTSGRIEYPLNELVEGQYRLQLRAFDVFNNMGEAEISFEVARSNRLAIRNIYNYPNPMHNFTEFIFEHNQPPGNPMDVLIRIYTLSGRPVARIEEQFFTNNNLQMIRWNGRDDDNHRLAAGTYLYHIRITTDTMEGRQTTDKIERLVVVR